MGSRILWRQNWSLSTKRRDNGGGQKLSEIAWRHLRTTPQEVIKNDKSSVNSKNGQIILYFHDNQCSKVIEISRTVKDWNGEKSLIWKFTFLKSFLFYFVKIYHFLFIICQKQKCIWKKTGNDEFTSWFTVPLSFYLHIEGFSSIFILEQICQNLVRWTQKYLLSNTDRPTNE